MGTVRDPADEMGARCYRLDELESGDLSETVQTVFRESYGA
jgi:hypothetical protein